jgi:hypothetical protein
MRNIRKLSPVFIASLALLLSFSALASGKNKNAKFPNIKIKNFGQMDDPLRWSNTTLAQATATESRRTL